MKVTNLIESLCLMFCIWSLRLAFLAAGCWMIYNGWYGCGLTTVVITVLIGGKYRNDDENKKGEAEK